ncbi:ABC transporter permease subunit [Aquincola sp. MAHUQ-54]|uniref:ABC transporter permease subunit n=1 Tax=Aquincola agrisoli TaxID=3119538 RepID=A0AAW9QME6_9BURK
MSGPVRLLASAWVVYGKELLDALRDRRTLLTVVLSSVAVGPVLLIVLSVLMADMEQRAEQREALVVGIEHAPQLRNFMERQTWRVRAAPADYEALLARSRLADAVLVVAPDFESRLARGEPPRLEIVVNGANPRSQASGNRLTRLIGGFASEQATLRLAMRGVSPLVADVLDVQPRDVSTARGRAAQLSAFVPILVLMAVLYGALPAALDSTAGERERGSLEPLLMTPPRPLALVLGKWAAVASVAMMVALLSSFGFLPAQWLLRSETLSAMFQYGWGEALMFLVLLLPLAAAVSAVLMAVAIRCRSVKEAQANATVIVLLVSVLPMVALFNDSGPQPWQLWVPALGQVTLMNRVLAAEAVPVADVAVPLLVCMVLAGLGLRDVARRLRRAAVR